MFISSHELSEVELICDRVAIIHKGVIRRQGKLTELLKGARVEVIADHLTREFSEGVKMKDATVSFADDRLIVDMSEEEDLNALLDSIRSAKGSVISVVPRRKRLEDLFVQTVREGAAEAEAQGS